MNRLIPLLLTAFACTAQAQQDYGYGGQSQGYEEPLAAPSTIPGQRSSSGTRVPQVQPAPNTPLPRQGQTQHGGIQWGSSSTPSYGGTTGGDYSPYGAAAGSTAYDPYPSSSTPYGGYGSDSPYGDADEPPPQPLDDGLR